MTPRQIWWDHVIDGAFMGYVIVMLILIYLK